MQRGLIWGMSGDRPKFELSVPQIAGSALAAVTAAVAASYLGVAGTVIGAAVVSVASTVATAIYTHYLKRTGDKVKQHTVIAWREPPTGDEAPEPVEGQGALATAVAATVRDEEPGATTLVMAPVDLPRRPLPWVKVGVAAALVFAVSMGGILAYQAIAQTTVHDVVTGTRTKQNKPPAREDKQQPSREPMRETPATNPATDPASTPEPTPTPTPTSKSPTVTPTVKPSDTGTAHPSPELTPSQQTSEPDATVETPPPDEPTLEQAQTTDQGRGGTP
ncbi:hypothetical protein ABT294_19705 [Nonomuraea sp. NPDC000554]|uniref:hypothetical protein n=1 Tax=Nonomuraea sp. NPDC000554 TaxID=3154259 RepID=UPI00332DBEC2